MYKLKKMSTGNMRVAGRPKSIDRKYWGARPLLGTEEEPGRVLPSPVD